MHRARTALIGGRLGSNLGAHRGRLLAVAVGIEIALVGIAFLVAAMAQDIDDPSVRYSLIASLAIAMGVKSRPTVTPPKVEATH